MARRTGDHDRSRYCTLRTTQRVRHTAHKCEQDTSYKLQHVQFCASQPTEGRLRRELHTYTCTVRRNVLSVDVYTAAVYANVHGRPSLRCVGSATQCSPRDETKHLYKKTKTTAAETGDGRPERAMQVRNGTRDVGIGMGEVRVY